jgi:glycogen debranching enzyme
LPGFDQRDAGWDWGRFDKAAAILRTFARVVDRGMLPNRFPDAGETLEYNTADATLWMFQAVSEYLDANRPGYAPRTVPDLDDIIHAHVEGTRYGIKVDPADGLLHAGEPACNSPGWMPSTAIRCLRRASASPWRSTRCG